MPRAQSQPLIEAFSNVLKAERRAAGLTQEALALNSDIDRTFVGLLETGKRQPSLSVLFALARALDLTPEALIQRVRREFGRVNHATIREPR